MRWFSRSALVFIYVFVIHSCNRKPAPDSDVLKGNYWKDQVLQNIIPYWTKYAQDKQSGAFYTTLDSLWQPTGDQNKYPSMVSRHLFSFSVSYLLSGNEEYLAVANSMVKWLLKNAWDNQFGGWYDAIDANGKPAMTTKTTFVQVYTITGLVMYYFVTHDSTVLQYIEKSNDLLEQKVWDNGYGGYHNRMNQDWSMADSNKDFGSQITPVSGYLLYLYQATKEKKYLDQTEKILDVTVKNMFDKESGWILENFDPKWKYLTPKIDEREINIGHNIEVSWMLLRSYLLTGRADQLEAAKKITNKLEASAVFNSKNIWLTSTARTSPKHGTNTYWWVQAYGNMYSLYLNHILKDDRYINDFRHGAECWDSRFLDKKHGDTYFSVDSAGRNRDAHRADRFKTSYHSVEHCLLNYLCLNHWVKNEPVELHFKITASKDGDHLYPVIIEDKNIKIRKVVIGDSDRTSLIEGSQSIRLPELAKARITVELINQP